MGSNSPVLKSRRKKQTNEDTLKQPKPPEKEIFTICDMEEGAIFEEEEAASSSQNDAAAAADYGSSKIMDGSTHSLSDTEESELSFSCNNSSSSPTTQTHLNNRSKTTVTKYGKGGSSGLPPIPNRSWTSASNKCSFSLWAKLKAKFTTEKDNEVHTVQKLSPDPSIYNRSDSMSSLASRASSKGQNPNEFNDATSHFRCIIVQNMQDQSDKLAEEQFYETMKKKQERIKEEIERKRKRELIKQEQAIRGQLPGSEHLRQRYSIMYHMNRERKHDALYVSSMLEMLLKKPGFSSSLSKFIAEEQIKTKKEHNILKSGRNSSEGADDSL